MEALQFLMLLIGGKTLIVVLMKMLFLINLDQLNNTFFDDNGNPYVQHIKIYDGDHYWDDKLSFNGKNTSGLIWDFVSQFDINGTIN